MKLFSKMINNRARKGFTLVEMLIVIAVLAIIMAVAVPNAAGYVRRIKLMELDDSARSIFMAVQNKMTVMKQSGESLKPDGSESYLGDIYPEIFTPASFSDSDESEHDGTTYIKSEPRYFINSKSTSNAFVELSTIEGQLYNHNYVIEYDATTGRVFGVFYSEDDVLTETFYLNTYMEKDPDGKDPRDFEERLKADKLVGYYGGEGQLMKVPAGGEVEKPTNVTDSTLEKLVFMLDPPFKDGSTTEYDNGKYYFEVKITGKDAKDQEHTITIVPYDSAHPEKNYYVQNGQRGTVILDSIAPGCGADNGKWYLPSHYNPSNYDMSGYTLERDFKGWVYINEAYKSTFFSDLNNFNDDPSMINGYDPYIHSVDEWNLGKSYAIGSYSNSWQYAQHFRIDPGTDITVTIKRYKDGLLDSEITHSVNSYFDSLEGDCAVIKAGRHLQNLANQPSVDKVKSARLEEDIDFSQDTGNYDSWNSAVTYKGTTLYPYLYNFKPVNLNFAPNRANFNFSGKGKDGTQHIIKYIRIDTVNDPRFNTDPEVQKNTAFFSSFYNTSASDVIFHCPVVIGRGAYTGVFFGQCTGGTNITNYTLVNPIVESSGQYVGGLFGEVTGGGNFSGHKVYVEEVTDYFDNYEPDYTKRDTRRNITWDDPLNDPYERFCVRGTGDNTYAGGMVGHTSGTQVKDSAAAIRVESKGYAGGLIGFAESDIIKCHVGGHTYNGWFVVPTGTMCGDTVISQPAYLINIKGKKASGGFAAKMTSGSIDGGYTTCSVGYYGSDKSLADTFVEGSSIASGSNDAYAIGVRIGVDSHEIEEKGTDLTGTGNFWVSLNDLLDKKKSSLEECNVLKKYDKTLQEKYPYRLGNSNLTDSSNQYCHLGDWPIPQTAISGYGMFYWEKEGSAYKIKAVGGFDIDGAHEVSTLCVDRDAQHIDEYGYGYFYSGEYTDGSTGGSDFTGDASTGIQNALNSAGLHGVTFKMLSSTEVGHGDKEFIFTTTDGTVSKEFHYNPDFCALSTSTLTEYEIRSFAQLKNLSNTDNSSYWNKNFKLSHDVVFGSTDSITPIGVSATPFTGEFNGHLYRIVDAKLTASGSDAGIFGRINNATVNGVVVFNADYSLSGLGDNAAVGGVIGRADGASTVTNCAFTGRIDAGSTGDIAAGGIVGIAEGGTEIQNCQAIMSDDSLDSPDMYLQSSNVSAGGIVGIYRSNSSVPLSNCYSGGYISADTALCENPNIGGIVGTNENTEVNINGCYTYYQTNVPGAHPICKKGGVGSLSFTNCYYLGGDWFNGDVSDTGIIKCDTVERLISDTNGLGGNGFSIWNIEAYGDDLEVPYSYLLPASISGNGQYYHYGKSPDDTMVAMGDKRFGVLYWEQEDGAYNLKVVYYKKSSDSVAETINRLCSAKDGHAITKSGYGYFIGRGVKNTGVNGFVDLPSIADSTSEYSGIVSSLENVLLVDSGELANNFKFAFYDCSTTNKAGKTTVSINSDVSEISSKKFGIVPGLCAIDDISDGNDHLSREVRTANHLRNISSAGMANNYHQTHDIICTGDFTPIGTETSPFKGEYDGKCYRIHNLNVTGSESNVGLFGTVSGKIIDTFVIDGTITGIGSAQNIGGIAGSVVSGAEIQNSIFTGAISQTGVSSNPVIGGLVGRCNAGTLTNCEAAAAITVTSNNFTVGGIVGVTNADINSCYSGGSLAIPDQPQNVSVGGIVGDGGNCAVTNCYTHMNIPRMDTDISTVAVNPIGNNVTSTSCHYIESKNHYANDFDVTDKSKITKHYNFNIVMGASDFGGVSKTYRHGLTLAINAGDNYPLPAVVKDGSDYVHYGDWKPIELLYAPGYGVFYWEKEGDGYGADQFRVRVCGIREVSEGVYGLIGDSDNPNSCKYIESKDFCYDMDGKSITDYGYGYFYNEANPLDVTVDDFGFSIENLSHRIDKTAGITKALKDLGIAGVKIIWGEGNTRKHEDRTTQLKLKDGNPLQVNGKDVYIKYNLDFCYLKMWTGVEPPDGEYKYEIRNAAQLSSISIFESKYGSANFPTTYLGDTYIQSHDIDPSCGGDNYSNPIGIQPHPFTGIYNGSGYRIINLQIKEEEKVNYRGFFGYTLDGAKIENVTVFNANINMMNLDDDDANLYIGAVGGLVAYAQDTTIENCAFYGNIDAGIKFNLDVAPRSRFAIGGIVGYGAGGIKVKNCESVLTASWMDAPLLSASYHLSMGGIAGILAGDRNTNNIESCYSGGYLTLSDGAGGYGAIGTVKATAAGIVGTGNVKVRNCYSYMNIYKAAKANDDIQNKNPIGNNFKHRPVDRKFHADYAVQIENCYCLTGNNFCNYDVNFDGVEAYDSIPKLAKVLEDSTSFSKQEHPERYNATAYGKTLTNPGHYPLAAVVSQKDQYGNKQYVHYGYVNGLIQYKVETKATPQSYGKVTVTPQYALPGDTVTVTATPAQNIYELDFITVDGVQISGNTFTMPEKDVKVVVTFKSRVHDIGFEPMTNGTITVKNSAEEGTKVTFSANPDYGYACKSVTVKYGNTIITPTFENGVYSFTMPSADVTISAVFEKSSVGIDKNKLALFRVANYYSQSAGASVDGLCGRLFIDKSWVGMTYTFKDVCGLVLNADVDVNRVIIKYYNKQDSTGVAIYENTLSNMAKEFNRSVDNPELFGDSKLWEFNFGGNCNDSNMLIDIIWVDDNNNRQVIWTSVYGVNPWN